MSVEYTIPDHFSVADRLERREELEHARKQAVRAVEEQRQRDEMAERHAAIDAQLAEQRAEARRVIEADITTALLDLQTRVANLERRLTLTT